MTETIEKDIELQEQQLNNLKLDINMLKKELKTKPSLEEKRKNIIKYVISNFVLFGLSGLVLAGLGSYIIMELFKMPLNIPSVFLAYQNLKMVYSGIGATVILLSFLNAMDLISNYKNYKIARENMKKDIFSLESTLQENEEKLQVLKQNQTEKVKVINYLSEPKVYGTEQELKRERVLKR